jgi:N,N-dimethylformamidase beta subunit-like, C-terminal/Concanavalin A-like lectin/glucanases superfamily
MKRTNRRQFIKHTGTGVAGLAALRLNPIARAAASVPPSPFSPSPGPLAVSGVHAYSTEKSVAAGKTISFCVSSTVPYRLSICRLGQKIDEPAGDEVLHEFPLSQPNPQPIHPGSYVLVERSLPEDLPQLTLECWVRPWKTERQTGLITHHDYPSNCGVGLFLTPGGGVSFYLGDGEKFEPDYVHQPEAKNLVQAGKWSHLVGVWDGSRVSLWVNGKRAGSWSWFGPGKRVRSGSAPLRLAAYSESGQVGHVLDGDLAMPVIYRQALSDQKIQSRYAEKGLVPASGREVLACWPLDEERGDQVSDLSSYHRDGRILNHATWMIGGPSYDADVPRLGNYDPHQDPSRGHGLRFASDDLYNCGWSVTHEYELPGNAKPGLYVARFQFEADGKPRLYHCTFIVRKAARAKPAPILVLCATNTWLAYNGTPFGVNSPELKPVFGTGGTKNSPGDPPAFDLYRAHAAGQGTCQVGLRMPWPAAGPYVLYGGPTGYSHLARADRFAQIWLEEAGYHYDVVSDLDLHRDPDLLRDYPVFLINGHSEYWSIEMYEGLKRYLARGGNAICLSGNSLFWRVSFNEDGTVMECRKVDAPGFQMPPIRRGECWHSQDGLRGGMMRECGFPGWDLVGLDTLGWNNQGNPEQFGPYVVDRPQHFLFQKPFPVDVQEGDPIGQASDGGLPRANGHEIDVRLSTLRALQEQPSPPGAVVPDDPPGMVRLANGIITWKKGGAAFDFFFRPIKPATDQGGEMIYWERTDGGKVFNAGSIGSGWALQADPKFQRLLKNVLAHFGVMPT